MNTRPNVIYLSVTGCGKFSKLCSAKVIQNDSFSLPFFAHNYFVLISTSIDAFVGDSIKICIV